MVDGFDYFLPDSLIERNFSFPISSFETMKIVIRIIYSDLVKDMNDCVPPHLLAYPNAKLSNNAKSQQRQEVYTSYIDCLPLVLPEE